MMKGKKSKNKRRLKDMLSQKNSHHDNDDVDVDNAVPKLYDQELGIGGVKVVNNWDKPKHLSSFQVTKKESKRRKQRQERFSAATPPPTEDDTPLLLSMALSSSRTKNNGDVSSVSSTTTTTTSTQSGTIVGTSTKLEKSYLRLTTFPKPLEVRPLSILEKSLQHIKTTYIKNEDFEWANNQLKAVRQDMTVQGIRTAFCIQVYETHARILLEYGDLNEFNQCQSMIRTLTEAAGRGGRDDTLDEKCGETPHHHTSDQDQSTPLKQSPENRDEFQGYQLLYSLVQNSWTDLTKALGGTIIRPHKNSMAGPSCHHAMLVIKSVIHNDYHGFFRLYESAPHLSAYLMDFLVHRVRSKAYERIVAAYRPTMGIEFFREALQFPNMEETRDFLKTNGAVFLEDSEAESWVDCKASHTKMTTRKGTS